jgi:hypothetical protein
MPKWFRYKTVGFGFTPNTLIGWLLTAALVGVLWATWKLLRPPHSPPTPTVYAISAVAIGVYVLIAWFTSTASDIN